MKKTIFLLSLTTLLSCSGIKQLANEEVQVVNGCEIVSLDNKIPLFEIKIDNQAADFLFDTGATRSVLIDSNAVPYFSQKKISNFGSAKGADGVKIQNKLLTVLMYSNIFESKNKVLSFINSSSNKCQKTFKSYAGIVGLDMFFDKNLSLQLDFSSNKICNISNVQLEELFLKSQFELVKSKCKYSQIILYLTIEGKDYPFKLDTGYSGSIIMPYNEKLNFKNEKKLELEGSIFQTISSHTNGKELIYEKMPISFAGENFESKVNVSTSIKAQNIGIEFIKGFDWLIDYNNNKVYVKRNQNKIESAFTRKVSYYVKANQDQLKIVVKEKSQTQYQLGDQIIAVNNQKVTAENNCELQDLLNKTEDWSTLQLEVISTH
jgi:hypothetical protein